MSDLDLRQVSALFAKLTLHAFNGGSPRSTAPRLEPFEGPELLDRLRRLAVKLDESEGLDDPLTRLEYLAEHRAVIDRLLIRLDELMSVARTAEDFERVADDYARLADLLADARIHAARVSATSERRPPRRRTRTEEVRPARHASDAELRLVDAFFAHLALDAADDPTPPSTAEEIENAKIAASSARLAAMTREDLLAERERRRHRMQRDDD